MAQTDPSCPRDARARTQGPAGASNSPARPVPRWRSVMEPIQPHPGAWRTRSMAQGEPGVPMRFTWRGANFVVSEVLGTQRETEPSPEGLVKERYVKRHIVEVLLESGERMRLSGSRGTGARAPRWILRQVADAAR